MPKKIPNEEFEAVVTVVAAHPGGVKIEAIRKGLDITLPDRMLQRRLRRLADEGRIVTKGTGKGKRYFPKTSPKPEAGEESRSTPATGGIRLSANGEAIKQSVLRPVSERTPVGYQSEFLASYEPNTTAYISDELQRELTEMGQVGQADLPAGTYLRQVMDRLLIDLSWNSSRLEGNTYSLLDTQRLFEQGDSAEGKAAEETQMILNHKSAIEMLAENAEGIGFNRYTICNLHALLSENLLPDPAAGGHVRARLVGISGTVYEPLEVPQQIEQYFDQILQKTGAIRNPFEQAFFVMVHIPYLQPFEDVNKRVSRLAANIPLIRHNLCPLSFVDVPQDDYVQGTLGVYELNRVEYLRDVFAWAYRRSCTRYSAIRQSLGEPDPFRLRYRHQIGQFVRGVVQDAMDKRAAAKWIAMQVTQEIPQNDQPRFVEVVETEISNLHEGNMARYRLRPSEFDAWKRDWK